MTQAAMVSSINQLTWLDPLRECQETISPVTTKKKTRPQDSNLGPKRAKKSLGLVFRLVALIPATCLSFVTFHENSSNFRKYIGNVKRQE